MRRARYYDRVRWETVKNVSGEEIPPYSVVWNDSDDDTWQNYNGDYVMPVQLGDNESSFSIAGGQRWLITGPLAIPVGGYGEATEPTHDCPMLVSIDPGESSTYTENLVCGPNFQPTVFGPADVKQASFGVTVNSSLPLWSVLNQVVLPGGGVDPQKYWVGPLRNIVGNVLLDGELPLKTYNAVSGSQTLLSLDPVPRTATFFVTFHCRVSIDTPNVLLLTTLLSNSTAYTPTISQSGRSTPNLQLSSGYELSTQQYPGSENIAMFGYAKVAKGDVIRLDFNTSQSCNVIFYDVKLSAVPFGAPNLGSSIPS